MNIILKLALISSMSFVSASSSLLAHKPKHHWELKLSERKEADFKYEIKLPRRLSPGKVYDILIAGCGGGGAGGGGALQGGSGGGGGGGAGIKTTVVSLVFQEGQKLLANVGEGGIPGPYNGGVGIDGGDGGVTFVVMKNAKEAPLVLFVAHGGMGGKHGADGNSPGEAPGGSGGLGVDGGLNGGAGGATKHYGENGRPRIGADGSDGLTDPIDFPLPAATGIGGHPRHNLETEFGGTGGGGGGGGNGAEKGGNGASGVAQPDQTGQGSFAVAGGACAGGGGGLGWSNNPGDPKFPMGASGGTGQLKVWLIGD